MTIGDGLHYIAIGNPVSKAIIGTTASIFSRSSSTTNNAAVVKAAAATSKAVGSVMPPIWKLAGHNYYFVRIAGLSGASAVILGAIGSHKLNTIQDKGEAKTIFDTANRFHFFHTLALFGMPLAKHPAVTGLLMLSGTVMFSGTLYYRAFTGEKRFAFLAPYGGSLLILAWLSLLF